MKRLNREITPTDLGYKKIDEITAKLAALREVANTDEFRAIANLLESDHAGNGTPDIDTYGYDKWTFSAWLSSLGSYSDPRVIALKDALTNLDPDECQDFKYENANNWDFHYIFKFEKDVQIKVTLNCYLDANSPHACRKIQVGTEMKEVPVYKNVCSAIDEAAAGELPAPVLNLENLV